MKHQGTITIETERLLLRKFVINDANNMYKNWASDNDVTKFLTWPTHSNVDISKSVLESWVEEAISDKNYQWCIELKSTKEAIGSIAVVHLMENIRAVEIGYCIGKEFWNQGLMPEAFQAIIQYFFREVQVNRIEARHDTNNPASGKVMIKCGLQFEGISRQGGLNNSGICDMAVYAILREDFEENF